ncbi:hypothetical protein JCM3775_004190 [Rhodotorula graminis]|uniref:Dynein light intermediate chain n=1 Tax=Rhodotorula graminis (strain WP1) TaxID=578459 RepID=A0A194SB88_RHOGW|nr:uncharacterized protein RHOBADRAFT_50512 [Rhodotorula graminis WP1]KPV77988.1 hypothetical protein RHOBADRAFT_50512 [Rhodotorula graminis WP1]
MPAPPSMRGSTTPSSLAAPAPPTTASSSSAPGVVLPGDGDLWSNILDSVKGSRSTPSKPCFVLGAPHSGKSTLVDRLRSPTGEPSSSTAHKGKETALNGVEQQQLDLGMSYDVIDVRDEGYDGDTLARLSVYQLSSPLPPYPSLLSLALVRDSIVLICLDWDRPWEFVRQLEQWVILLDELLGRAGKDKEGDQVDGREQLEAFIRSYAEPAAPGSTAPTTSSSSAAAALVDLDSPLPPGTLTDNLGVGLIFVCTKADQMNSLEREREFSEEQFDFVQQTLRTIALRYGAAVFYTAQTLPTSYAKLRQYIVHRLFSSPPSSTSLASPSSSAAQPTSPSAAVTSTRAISAAPSTVASFPFPHRANVVDHEAVLVPAGWDSWGKIRILRERFDCETVGRGWEVDLERKSAAGATSAAREGASAGADGGEGERGLENEYGMVVVDFDAEDSKVNLAPAVSAFDEQAFLREHYDVLQADTAADPRLAFRQPGSSSSSLTGMNGFGGALGPSVVGPMAGTSLDLPTVVSTMERARERADAGAGAAAAGASREERYRAGAMSRQSSSTSAGIRSPPLGGSTSGAPGLNGDRPSPTLSSSATFADRPSSRSSTSAAAGAAAPAASSAAGVAAGGNQVLADFFQSLLTARTAGTGAAAGSGAASAAGAGQAAPAAGGLRASVARGATPPSSSGGAGAGEKADGQ